MRKRTKRNATSTLALFLAVVGSVMLLPGAAAALDAVLYLPGIEGESPAPSRAGAIVIDAYSFTHANNGTGSATYFSPLSLVKPIDKASPKLLSITATGQSLPNARLDVFGSDPSTPLFRIEMVNVNIRSIGAAAGLSGNRESIGLSFTEVTWTHFSSGGQTQECFNLVSMTSC